MKRLSCVGSRRRLSAFQDGELPVTERVAVDAHLRQCPACAADLAGLREVGDALRAKAAAAAARHAGVMDDLQADILGRLSVEREESMSAQLSRAFQDMRLGFAALGSTAATLVSILLVIGIFYFGPRTERPDSLAGMMETLEAETTGMDSRVLAPRSSGTDSLSDGLVSEEDEVFALSAVVTRNGRIANLEYLSDQLSNSDRARAVRLLDNLSRARFEPARMDGTAVAVKRVFVLAHTTVRAKMPVTPKQSAAPRGPELIRG
jgi:hypothetical protein